MAGASQRRRLLPWTTPSEGFSLSSSATVRNLVFNFRVMRFARIRGLLKRAEGFGLMCGGMGAYKDVLGCVGFMVSENETFSWEPLCWSL